MARFITAALFMLACSLSAQPSSGNEVIRNMHEAYKGKWYSDLTFTQQSIFYKDGAVDRQEIWYEAMKIPKGLIIKIASKDSGNGLLFVNDTQYVFRSGSLRQKIRRPHDLLVLGFEVYHNDPSVTVKKLEELGFDMSKCSVETGPEGKQYVVGDTARAQFWITAETHLFTKMRKKDTRGGMTEVQFNKYEKLGGGWISPEVLFLRNGQVAMKELYSDCTIEKMLPDSLFDPLLFQAATW